VASGWTVDRRSGPAAVLHGLDPALDEESTIRVLDVDAAALVLGSAQPVVDVDGAAAAELGVDVVRRHSGGGAVLLEPGAVVWVDVIVPRHDPRWDDDVVRSMVAVGEWFAGALADLGVSDLAVHRGRLDRTPLARLLCFGGLGPGEVTSGGRKLVGVSQRRTRDRARFQVALLRRWDAERTVRLLGPGLGATGVDATALDDLVTTVPDLATDQLLAGLTGS
jgi:lipoate---protein ligase